MGDQGKGEADKKVYERKKDFRKKRCWIKKGRMGEQNKVAKKKKKRTSKQQRRTGRAESFALW